ncbi:MAG: DUF4426 domain-containing protein [Proteobacteria bacterium]|nr:DUF4426 domain-containing protein [Pseudomonadota bacterium]
MTTMISNRWGIFFLIVIVIFTTSACSENRPQSVNCNLLAVPEASQLTALLGHEVDYKALNSTSLDAEVAKLYGIDQDETLGVVMVSIYQTDEMGIGVEACVNGWATNLIGQMKRLDFEEIREGAAIYHISTFSFSHKDYMTFEVDVQCRIPGDIHRLKWKQQFWRG